MSEQARLPRAEALTRPSIEGLRILDVIDVAKISALVPTDDVGIWLSDGDAVPRAVAPFEEVVQEMLHKYPGERGCVHVSKFSFGPDMEDPFHARMVADWADPAPEYPVHQDDEVKVTVLVSDVYPTIFYPDDENGQADISRGWQPKPGEVVEINNRVWHGAPAEVTGTGQRTLVTLRILNY
jgi:hypothetical protein